MYSVGGGQGALVEEWCTCVLVRKMTAAPL